MHLGKLKCRDETIHRLMFMRITVHEVKKVEYVLHVRIFLPSGNICTGLAMGAV